MGDTYVCTSALMTCTFGIAPCPLVVNPSRTVMIQGKQRANISDFVPLTNIASFGMCSAPTNPTVIAATAAAMGVFTPMPCVPAIVSPWMPGKPDLLVQGMPALTKTSRNMCMWLGQISFTNEGQLPTPGPIITPQVGKQSCVPSGIRRPLTKEEMSSLSEDDKKQYNKDMEKASKAGDKDEKASKELEKLAADYEKKGDTEKAATARKAAESSAAAAANKRNTAMGDVNQKYRETMPPSKEEMAKLTDSQKQQYEQKKAAIEAEKNKAYREADIDGQIYKNASNDMMSPDNYSDPREMSANKGSGLIVSVIGALKEHYAKKDADEKAYEAQKELNKETHQQIKDNEGC